MLENKFLLTEYSCVKDWKIFMNIFEMQYRKFTYINIYLPLAIRNLGIKSTFQSLPLPNMSSGIFIPYMEKNYNIVMVHI